MKDFPESRNTDVTQSEDTTDRSTLVSRNVRVSGRRTSMRLEPQMWDALLAICHRERRSMHEICTEINDRRNASSLTAEIRVYIMHYFLQAATEDGHARAGHRCLAPI